MEFQESGTLVAILIISFLVSLILSLTVLKRKNNKRLARLVGFVANMILLSAATIYLYETDFQGVHKQMEGIFESLGIAVLLFFVPILTIFNVYILEFVGRGTNQLNE